MVISILRHTCETYLFNTTVFTNVTFILFFNYIYTYTYDRATQTRRFNVSVSFTNNSVVIKSGNNIIRDVVLFFSFPLDGVLLKARCVPGFDSEFVSFLISQRSMEIISQSLGCVLAGRTVRKATEKKMKITV